MEAQLIGSTATLFVYRFKDPGVYSFYNSLDPTKKFYVRGLKIFFCFSSNLYEQIYPSFLVMLYIRIKLQINYGLYI